MKAIFYSLLVMTMISCNKASIDDNLGLPNSNNNTIEYRITATNASNIYMNYYDKDQIQQGGSCSSGWVVQFSTSLKPYTAYLRANAQNPSPSQPNMSLTVKILVNGTIVKQSTVSGNVTIDKEIQYVIQ